MNVMRSFTLKSLKRNKKRTIVTIIGVIISAAMLTAVSVFFSSFVSLIQRDTIASDGNWHAEIQGVLMQNVETITGNENLDSIVISRDLGYSVLEGSVNESKPYLLVRQYSENGYEQMSVKLLEGRLPQNNGEVVISETIDNSAGVSYSIGDTLDLSWGKRVNAAGDDLSDSPGLNYIYNEDGTERTLDEMLVPQSEGQFTIVGIMTRPTFEQSWSAGCGVLGYLDTSALSPSDKVDAFLTMKTVSNDIFSEVESIANQAQAQGGVEFHNELLRYYGVVSHDNVLTFLYAFAGIIVLVIMLASVSLIYNSFAISVSERSRQLGLLSSVGATKRQKRYSMYYEGFIIGLIGIPFGLLAGIGGMAVTLTAIQPLLDSFFNVSEGMTLDLVVPLWSVGATIVLAAITIFVSVYVPARRASRITPIDAIRLSQDLRLSRRAVKTSGLTRALFGFEATVALKNLKRSRKKYRATIVSLTISIVLFLTVSMYASMTQSIYGVTEDGYNYDISVSYSNVSDTQQDSTNESIASLDLVTGHTQTMRRGGNISISEDLLSESAKKVYGEIDDSSSFGADLVALDEESFRAYADSLGVSPQDFADTASPKAILINYGQSYYSMSDEKLTKISGDILNVQKGDELSFYTGPEHRDDAAALTIGAITDERPMGTLIQSLTNVTLVVSEEVFHAVVSSTNSLTPESLDSTIFVTTSDDQKLEKQLSQVLHALPSSSYYVYNIQSANRSQQSLNTFLGVFVYGFIILISLICIANIFNTVSTNIALRRREFAMLRSVGMTPGGFNRMVRFESVFYGLKALLFGLPVSVAISYLLYTMQQSVLISGFTLPWESYGFAVLMLLIIVFATMLYSTHKIKRENIIDALKDEAL